MFYKIKPLDTLFFRDGRPFSMGAETWANPIFPPYPSTIYGAIRTWLIFERGNLKDFEDGKFENELGRIIKDEKGDIKVKKGSLKMKGSLVALNDILYFPVPKDLLKRKDKNEERLYSINLIKKPEILTSEYPLKNVLINKEEFELDEVDEFIDINSLKDYLKNSERILEYTDKEKIFKQEKKTGIKRSKKTLSSEEGHLYRIPMIRLEKGASLFVEIEGLNSYPENGVIQIGGEGKTAKIEKCSDLLESIRNLNFKFKNRMFKLYLATPAIFNKGWIPEWIEENFEGNYKEIKLRLISCSIGKYNLIGGWDLARKRPKPMYKAVPAGSVYYFEILDDTPAEKIKETFHLKNISDINPQEGFGLSLVGEM